MGASITQGGTIQTAWARQIRSLFVGSIVSWQESGRPRGNAIREACQQLVASSKRQVTSDSERSADLIYGIGELSRFTNRETFDVCHLPLATRVVAP